jgi:hypothetical protein
MAVFSLAKKTISAWLFLAARTSRCVPALAQSVRYIRAAENKRLTCANDCHYHFVTILAQVCGDTQSFVKRKPGRVDSDDRLAR